METIQAQMSTPDNYSEAIQQEKIAKMELEKWSMVEESILKQKSSVQWLKLGDSNTTYFYACMKNRQTQNHISKLINSAGQIIHNVDEVKEKILKFYKGLLGTAAPQLPAVVPDIMHNGYTLNRSQ